MDGNSSCSSLAELDLQQQRLTGAAGSAEASCSAEGGCDGQDVHRTHHLLKHCLSSNQKGEALHHFNTTDVKEAAKDISRMGQRELQSKFKCVYGSVTHSNNNDWLRRKLYEAIGAAPLKAVTKGKSRKTAGSAKPRRSADHASAAPHPAATERRRRSLDAKGSPAMVPGVTAALRLKRSAPSSPRLNSSVLDVHRIASNDTTTSESEDGSHDRPGDIHVQSTDCDTPRSTAGRGGSSPFSSSLFSSQPLHIRPARTRVGLVPVRPLGGSAPASAPLAPPSPASPPPFLPHSAFPTGMHQAVGCSDVLREFELMQSQPGSLSHTLQASRTWSAGLSPLQLAPAPFQPATTQDSAPDWQNEAWAELTNLSFTDLSFDLKSSTPLPSCDEAVPGGLASAVDDCDDDVMLMQVDLSAFDDAPAASLGL